MKIIIKNKSNVLLDGDLSVPIIPRVHEAIIIEGGITRVLDVKYDFVKDYVEIEVEVFKSDR